MTAQIAIMNKNAVALATDSAVTMNNPQGVKVHNSANKLFMLSKFEPVGIMIYASADFMEYPWETLIKVYRRWLGKRSFPRLSDYGQSFFDFLLAQASLFTPEKQSQWFHNQVKQMLGVLKQAFNDRVRQYMDQHPEINEDKVEELFEQSLSDAEATFLGKEWSTLYAAEEVRDEFWIEGQQIIRDAIKEVLQALPIATFEERLASFVSHWFMSNSTFDYSGIVFAGFGNEEVLPVTESFWIDGIFGGRVRRVRQDGLSANLNQQLSSWILPFAQSDTVLRFLKGIDPTYRREAESRIATLFKETEQQIRGFTATLYESATEHEAACGALHDFLDHQRSELWGQMEKLERDRFLSPVMDVVAGLQKDDLAAIAESLVNLTSFQRKILREAETVGGPIDVAVISKGDGFVWIKRKHYFEKDLNPAFFANYYRGEDDES